MNMSFFVSTNGGCRIYPYPDKVGLVYAEISLMKQMDLWTYPTLSFTLSGFILPDLSFNHHSCYNVSWLDANDAKSIPEGTEMKLLSQARMVVAGFILIRIKQDISKDKAKEVDLSLDISRLIFCLFWIYPRDLSFNHHSCLSQTSPVSRVIATFNLRARTSDPFTDSFLYSLV